jgi:uncharacterized protein
MSEYKGFNRLLFDRLIDWKSSPYRKPLILRGARQVGKTTLVNQFAEVYTHKIFLNLELKSDREIFETSDEVEKIVEILLIRSEIPSGQLDQVLLFIDEIQESPNAIALLRYFYEKIPQLHVIAAGSLLEQAIKKVKSFPVGRVEYLYLFPLNFEEFLSALGKTELLKVFNQVPVNEIAHNLLLDAFNLYAIIGGMPEVVQRYIDTNSISSLSPVYSQIWQTYREDVEKYSSNQTEANIIRYIMEVAHLYLDQRVKFERFGNSNYKSREVGEAFRKLDQARIIQLIYPSTVVEAPIQMDVKKSPRIQFLDTGIINNELKIQGDLLALKDLSNEYKGALIPHLLTQEIISLNQTGYHKPNFWVREKTQASSEVDLIIQYKQLVIPIEIKSGKSGKLKSLHQFIEQSNHTYAVRIYGGKFLIEEQKTQSGKPFKLMNLPYYLGTKIHFYVDYFLSNY